MKLPRPLLTGIAVIAGIVVLAIGAAFSSVFQTWAARRALNAAGGISGEVRKVSVGLGRVTVEQLRVHGDGYRLTVPALEAHLPVISALRDSVEVRRLVAKGWTLDLTAPRRRYASEVSEPVRALAGLPALLAASSAGGTAPATPAAIGKAFHGIFSVLDLPFDLAVDSAELEGEIIFPVIAGQAPGRARVLLTGGRLQSGSEGRFTLVATLAVDDPNVRVNQLDTRSELVARMDSRRTFDRIEATVVATASGPQAPNGARLTFDLMARRAASGESYAVNLRSAVRSLAEVKGGLPADGLAVSGSWSLDMKEGDLAPFTLGRPLPIFAVAGTGTYEVDGAFTEMHAEGSLQANVERLEAVSPELAGVGAVQLAADFDVAGRGSLIHVKRFGATLSGGEPVAHLQALQGLEWDRRTGELRVAEPDRDLLSISLTGLPWRWIRPWTGGHAIEGETLRGELLATARGGRFSLRTTVPLAGTALTLSRDGNVLLANVDVELAGSGEYTPQGWQAELSTVSMRSGNAQLFALNTLVGQALGRDQPVKITGSVESDLAALSMQPFAAAYPGLDDGNARATFNLRLSHRDEIGVDFSISELRSAGEVLPSFAGELRADVLNDGSIDLKLPVTVSRAERVSDMEMVAALKPLADRREITAQLSSRTLHAQDLKVLAALGGLSSQPPAKGAQTEPPSPIWEGFVGRVMLDLKRLYYAPDAIAQNVVGSIRLSPSALVVEDISSTLGDGGMFKLGGAVAFDPVHPEMYSLQADMTVNGFDPGPVLRTLNPAAPPPLEGKFNVVSRFSGRSRDFAGLMGKASGGVTLNSRGGTLRALSVDIAEYARAGTRLASMAGLIGLATGDERVLKYSERLRAASDVAASLAAVNFDQLTVEVVRTVENHFVIKDLAVISPTIRLLGSGIVEHQPGVSVWSQPLSLRLQLGARDRLAANLRTLKLLTDEADALGYTPLTENIVLDGSLENIGTSRLRELLVRALNGT